MTIDKLIEMLNQVKAVHPDGGNAEVCYEYRDHHPWYPDSVEIEYLDIDTFGIGDCNVVLLKY